MTLEAKYKFNYYGILVMGWGLWVFFLYILVATYIPIKVIEFTSELKVSQPVYEGDELTAEFSYIKYRCLTARVTPQISNGITILLPVQHSNMPVGPGKMVGSVTLPDRVPTMHPNGKDPWLILTLEYDLNLPFVHRDFVYQIESKPFKIHYKEDKLKGNKS